MSPRRFLIVIGVCAVSSVGLAACGGGGDGDGSGGGSTVAVDTGDFFFRPASQTASVGDEVTWTNSGGQLHTVKGPGFAAEPFGSGESYSHTFDEAGTYAYVCTLHPTQMQGKIVVTG